MQLKTATFQVLGSIQRLVLENKHTQILMLAPTKESTKTNRRCCIKTF